MKKIFYISILTLALSPAIAFADSAVPGNQSEFGTSTNVPPYVLLTPLPCIGATNGTTCTSGTNGSSQITSIGIQGYLLYLFKLLIALTVFLAVVMTIFGGFKYMTVESVTGKSDAKKTIQNAAEGLLLALASYLILYTINPNLVNLSKVAVPKLNVATTTININTNQPTSNSGVTIVNGVCHAAGQNPTRANIVPCPGSQPATPAATHTCTTHGYDSRTHRPTTSTFACDSNGNAV